MKLIRSALTTACLLATAWAVAAPSPVRMDGETLPQEFVGQMTKSERLKEYVAADETFERWTRLIGLRLQSAPQIGNDPLKMAQNMAALARRQYPDMPPPNIRPQKDGAVVQFYARTKRAKMAFLKPMCSAIGKTGRGCIPCSLPAARLCLRLTATRRKIWRIKTSR